MTCDCNVFNTINACNEQKRLNSTATTTKKERKIVQQSNKRGKKNKTFAVCLQDLVIECIQTPNSETTAAPTATALLTIHNIVLLKMPLNTTPSAMFTQCNQPTI